MRGRLSVVLGEDLAADSVAIWAMPPRIREPPPLCPTARMLNENGLICLASLTPPMRRRERVAELIGRERYVEVYVMRR